MTPKKHFMVAVTMVATSVFLSGCAPKGLYDWGGYERSLYDYYKNPNQLEELAISIKETIKKSAGRIPPGLYAEYGGLMLQQGKKEEAIIYFEKEREAWPESKYFMDSLIGNLSRTTSSATSKD